MADLTQPGPAAQGFGQLVGALLGRDKIRQSAQDKALQHVDKLARAKLDADEFNARQTLADALTAANGNPTDPAALAALVRSGNAGNYQQITAGSQNLADIALQAEAANLARQDESDVDKLNRVLAARSGKPLAPKEAVAATLGQALIDTERAKVGVQNARATAANAQASRYGTASALDQARADLAARTNPNLRVSKGKLLGEMQLPANPEKSQTLGENIGGFVQAFVANEGRAPTPEELNTIASGGTVRVMAPQTGSTRAWSQAEVAQAMKDARAAVATGKISRAKAQQRLRDAGLHNAARAL